MFEPTHAALQDILRVFLAAAHMLKNHLPLLVGATALTFWLSSANFL